MKAKTLLTATLALGLAVLLGWAWLEHGSEQEAGAALDLLAQKRAALDAGILHAKSETAAADRERATLQSALPPAPTAARAGVKVTRHPNVKTILALLATDPKLYALGAKAFRANLGIRFGPLYRSLNLTPDQINQFETLVVQHQEAIIDIMGTASAQGVAFNDPAVSTLVQQENSQFGSMQQSLLGDAGLQQLQQFSRALPMTGVVNQVANSVALTSTPLTGAQADQLTQILAASSSNYQNGGTATPATINWLAVLGQAQAVLSPVQYDVLKSAYASVQVAQLQAQFAQREKGSGSP